MSGVPFSGSDWDLVMGEVSHLPGAPSEDHLVTTWENFTPVGLKLWFLPGRRSCITQQLVRSSSPRLHPDPLDQHLRKQGGVYQ